MNLHVPPTTEALAAHYRNKAVRERLGVTQKRVNVIASILAPLEPESVPEPSVAECEPPKVYPPPTEAMKAREPRWHMEDWESYKAALSKATTAIGFVKLQCFAHGIPYSELAGPGRKRALVQFRHNLICLTHEAFPHLSMPHLGRIFGRDHTSILNALGKIDRKGKYERVKDRKARQEAA